MTIPPIPSIDPAGLVARYEVLLVDAYGVLVDHAQALPGAAAFLHRLREAERRFLVVSNARGPAHWGSPPAAWRC